MLLDQQVRVIREDLSVNNNKANNMDKDQHNIGDDDAVVLLLYKVFVGCFCRAQIDPILYGLFYLSNENCY
jgi:hypothetical protein